MSYIENEDFKIFFYHTDYTSVSDLNDAWKDPNTLDQLKQLMTKYNLSEEQITQEIKNDLTH